jgi:hypothetical protein
VNCADPLSHSLGSLSLSLLASVMLNIVNGLRHLKVMWIQCDDGCVAAALMMFMISVHALTAIWPNPKSTLAVFT